MALSGFWLRGARGKLAGSVLQKGVDGTIIREKVKPSNPNSEGQKIQRMIFGTVAMAYSVLKTLCNHSFEGVLYGPKSQRKFFSLNLKQLRAFYPKDQDPNVKPYESKAYLLSTGEGQVGCGLQISAGSIPEVAPQVDNDGVLIGFGKKIIIPEGEKMTIARMLECVGAVKGDQITVVAITDDHRLLKSRYVIRPDATDEETNVEWDNNGELAAFDKTKTEVGSVILEVGTEGNAGFAHVETKGVGVNSVSVILSRKDGEKWLRSNAWLRNSEDEGAQYSAAYALDTWGKGGTDIETVNNRYLNNADV